MKSGEKYQAVGLQFISLGFDSNIIANIGFTQLDDGDAAAVSQHIMQKVEELGLSFDDAIGASQQDGAAGSVADELGVPREVCLMHSADKVGSSAIGDLTRSKKKRVINPFTEG